MSKLILTTIVLLCSITLYAQEVVYNKSGEVHEREFPSKESNIVRTYSNFSFIFSYDSECGYDYDEREEHKKYLSDCMTYSESCDNWYFVGSGYIHLDDVHNIYNRQLSDEIYIDEYSYEFRSGDTIVRIIMAPFDTTKHTIDIETLTIDDSYPYGGFSPEPQLEFKEVEVI
ncbi:MAG: hypothetical protein LBG19_06355 [Prevotellaceae bacterium]|jgi:hypothetical protein|nr:hypothetical protein [Prevotellaceae bacterium]